jgi:hypothetical protein
MLSLQLGGLQTAAPLGSKAGTQTETTISRCLRDPEVVAWVLESAKDVCEVCKKPAPFLRSDGFHTLKCIMFAHLRKAVQTRLITQLLSAEIAIGNFITEQKEPI